MPSSYSIDPARRIVFLKWNGNLTYLEWEARMSAVLDDPDFDPTFSFLSDWRTAQPPSVDHVKQGIQFIQRRSAELAERCKWAVVVSEIVTFGMARMGSTLAQKTPLWVEPFHDYDEALDWLLD